MKLLLNVYYVTNHPCDLSYNIFPYLSHFLRITLRHAIGIRIKVLRRHLKDVTLFQTDNLVGLAHLIGNGITWRKSLFNDISILSLNPPEEKGATRDIPGLLLLQMKVHAEFPTLVEVENLATIQFIIHDDDLVPPALLNASRSHLLAVTGTFSQRPHGIDIERLIINIYIIRRLSHNKVVKLAAPGHELYTREILKVEPRISTAGCPVRDDVASIV